MSNLNRILDFRRFMNETVYDYAAKTGMVLWRDKVDRATVSGLLEVFQSEPDALNATLLLIAHILRQMGRGEIHRDAGNELLRHLNEIVNNLKGEELKNAVLKYLTLSKWIFEARPRVSGPINKFTDLVKALAR